MTVWNDDAYLEDVQAGVVQKGDDAMGWDEQACKYAITEFEFTLEPDWTKNLPENDTLKGIRKESETVYLDFEQKYMLRMDEETGDPFGKTFAICPPVLYYDAEDKIYIGEIRWDWELDENGNLLGESGEYEWTLKEYPYEEVWLENFYSSSWQADKEISVEIK